mmetsp:Transcript_9894/g.13055  ORF Transcript_9894/g.13055 Transcript_9894/m.13055 type:complete len:568 (+) Transcript_9894:298-2001(+)|eukprot:CAMPEP_0198153154 /NCGR_PEP_ID=MMETSP1443-20131203/62892_1 /TAXON_ID=186043 /ORGANISM="Entomoneis sp., Strain CCMP2396" /LENGTH=567 /DNA_ID=CAMNT_0043819395 /DNA_START=281 /DNA_END=1984 /DNA_ORIENTATION=+
MISCGGISQLPSEDRNEDNEVVVKSHSHDGTTNRIAGAHHHQHQHQAIMNSSASTSGLPPRKQNKKLYSSNSAGGAGATSGRTAGGAIVSSTSGVGAHHHHHHNEEYDHDQHTLGTATTASATISYSTDQGDASIASEVGMEVVMAIRSRDSQDAPGDQEHILQPASSSSSGHHQHHHMSSYQSHSFQAGKHTFTVDRRYSFIRTIGSGAYGVVVSASDAKTNSELSCAIKMVPKAFSDEIDAKRILREIKLLKHFQHDNIVNIIDMMPPNVKYLEDFNDVYMVADLMETDLHRIIYSKQKLSVDHVQYFIYQVLRGLKYIHSCKVLHRDLKPSNLLVNSNCDLKICDFGLARGIEDRDTTEQPGTMLLTEYVVTRWYRAPEIMLACHEYSYPIDVWSVGCIFGELLMRKPMFPGEDYIDQLTLISDKLGKLQDDELDFVTSDKAKRFMKKLPSKTPKHFSASFPGASNDALDVMRKMLQIHPYKRISVHAALQHAFFEPLHNPRDEPVADQAFDFSFEDQKLHRLKLQELIWKEVADFRPSVLPVAPTRRQPQPAAGTGGGRVIDP